MSDNVMKLDDNDKYNDMPVEERCNHEDAINITFLRCTKTLKHFGKHYAQFKTVSNDGRLYELQIYWQEIPVEEKGDK